MRTKCHISPCTCRKGEAAELIDAAKAESHQMASPHHQQVRAHIPTLTASRQTQSAKVFDESTDLQIVVVCVQSVTRISHWDALQQQVVPTSLVCMCLFVREGQPHLGFGVCFWPSLASPTYLLSSIIDSRICWQICVVSTVCFLNCSSKACMRYLGRQTAMQRMARLRMGKLYDGCDLREAAICHL